MRWMHVGSTVTPYPDAPQYVLLDEEGMLHLKQFETIRELASAIKGTKVARNDEEMRCIKNDLPAIIWVPDGCKASSDTVLECQRLDKNELWELASLLRR